MWKWLARRVARHLEPPPPPPKPALDLGGAMQIMLVDAVRASGEAVAARTKSDTEFLTAMAEIRNKTAAQALGHAGGKERARRAKLKQTADPTYCPVCKHDNVRSTRSIIVWHMHAHAGPRPPMQAMENTHHANPEQTRAATDIGRESDGELRTAKLDTGTND